MQTMGKIDEIAVCRPSATRNRPNTTQKFTKRRYIIVIIGYSKYADATTSSAYVPGLGRAS